MNLRKTWFGKVDLKLLNNQIYVFGKQLQRIQRVYDKVDVVITDSPLILSAFYQPDELKETNSFENLVFETFSRFNNLNFFLKRQKKYNPLGRLQTEEEVKELDNDLIKLLVTNFIPFEYVDGNKEGVNYITSKILEGLL